DERVARQHLAVEDPGAVEARRLDGPEQTHEVGHRRRAGDAQVDTDRLAHRASWYTHNAMSERLGQFLVDLPNPHPMRSRHATCPPPAPGRSSPLLSPVRPHG